MAYMMLEMYLIPVALVIASIDVAITVKDLRRGS